MKCNHNRKYFPKTQITYDDSTQLEYLKKERFLFTPKHETLSHMTWCSRSNTSKFTKIGKQGARFKIVQYYLIIIFVKQIHMISEINLRFVWPFLFSTT